jgi:predicted PurR-regulated permease PerM
VNKQARVSYYFIAATIALAGWLHLATPLLAALFAYFVLTKLDFMKGRAKWLAVTLFIFIVLGVAYLVGYFINQAVEALPRITDKAVPAIIQWAQQHQVEMPFTDYDSLKDLAIETVRSQAQYISRFANFARGATAQFVLLIAGCVVAISVFLHPRFELEDRGPAVRNNLYSLCCAEIARRFGAFYDSFATVMGAQIGISAINTVLTSVFVLVAGFPYAVVVIGMTFLCGFIPVVGNLISNSVVVGIGFTLSPRMALVALVFLIVVHKLEYILNSKIVGERIRSPVWLTLLGLILGERLMGIPGMILAPVVLNYIRTETSRIEVKEDGELPAPNAQKTG